MTPKSRLLLFIFLPVFFSSPVFAETYRVQKVIDGDTLQLSNGEHVRLIGVDTPESRANQKALRDSQRSGQDVQTITRAGKEATRFVRQIAEGKAVRLEFDVQRRDKYGRLLAYVFMPITHAPSAERHLNAYIVQEGYAVPLTIAPNVKYSDTFVELAREARDKKRGLWAHQDSLFAEPSVKTASAHKQKASSDDIIASWERGRQGVLSYFKDIYRKLAQQ